MKIKVSRSELLHELSQITPVVEKSTKLPILSHILIDANRDDETISLAGSDLDVSIKTSCPANIEEKGAIAIPARELTDLVRYLPEDSDIEICTEDSERVFIISGKSKSRMVCLPDETFPEIPAIGGEDITIPGDILRKMIQMTIFSVTQEQSRFTLNGILLILNRNFIKMVSTDGHRMAYVEATKEFENLEKDLKILIPKKTVAELYKILQADQYLFVQFANDENHLFFKMENRLLVSRLLAGQFPNYELVIPRNLKNKLIFTTQKLKQSVNRVNVLADEISKRIMFKITSGQMLLRTENIKKGEAEMEIEIDYSGADVSLGFNSQYLLEFLNVVESEEVIFEFSDNEAPGLFRPHGELDYVYKYVIMPMSI
ncbi:MAG: DNA polymerase III subunit beta [Acidobacteria bacterium]|nr:DNA polymerase III subunit beta [Acidobacteriota bacterium]